MKSELKSVAVIGTGPAGLMAADTFLKQGVKVSLFEKKKRPGRKLLIAGSSGLNVTHAASKEEFSTYYTGSASPTFWSQILAEFSPHDWLRFINHLGIDTFEGTSGRFFVKGMKASKLLRTWTLKLLEHGAEFHFEHDCTDFQSHNNAVTLEFNNHTTHTFDAACFALGGGSYEQDLSWPTLFTKKGIKISPLRPSNVGFHVTWKPEFLKEAEGQPLKNISLSSGRGSHRGDAMVTAYGIEGTPVYFAAQPGPITLDLKPDLSLDEIISKCRSSKENLSPIRRIKKWIKLSAANHALLFHHTPDEIRNNLEQLCARIKNFPIELGDPRPLQEAISTSGGVCFSELTESLMLKRFPKIFLAGEMLDWDAPTGGFLIQACVSQAVWAAKNALKP